MLKFSIQYSVTVVCSVYHQKSAGKSKLHQPPNFSQENTTEMYITTDVYRNVHLELGAWTVSAENNTLFNSLFFVLFFLPLQSSFRNVQRNNSSLLGPPLLPSFL